MAKEPKILLTRMWVIYNVLCFFMAVYMTVILIGRYEKDKSATSIAYRKYAERDEDRYPTFTICVNGDGLYRYNESAIYRAYGINSANYEKILQGEPAFRYEYDIQRHLYTRTSLPVGYKTYFKFKDFAQNSNDISGIIKESEFEAENPSFTVSHKKENISGEGFLDNPLFYISFQTLKTRCLSREWRYDTGVIRVKDSFTLDMDFLNLKFHTRIDLFIHHPGQLIRDLDNPIFTFEVDESRYDYALYDLQMKVSQSAVWRKRSVKRRPCLQDIDDYDQYIQEAISRKLGCVPPFWNNRVNLTSLLEDCTSLEKLQQLKETVGDFKSLFHGFQTPCTDMFNTVSWNKKRNGIIDRIQDKLANIEILYADRYYEEIAQVADFGVQDFISNLGGFIGIFLGYSMMQIPELLGKI